MLGIIKLKVKCYFTWLIMSLSHIYILSKPATDFPWEPLTCKEYRPPLPGAVSFMYYYVI